MPRCAAEPKSPVSKEMAVFASEVLSTLNLHLAPGQGHLHRVDDGGCRRVDITEEDLTLEMHKIDRRKGRPMADARGRLE